MKIRLQALTGADLPTLRQLLGSSDFGGCFCAVWTSFDEHWLTRCQDPAQPNFEITRQAVQDGRQAGFLIYGNEVLIGWTGAGPKTAFPLLMARPGSRLSAAKANVWSIGCIALKAAYRGQGLLEPIVQALIEAARAAAALTIEAYPIDPWDEPRRYRGALSTYQRLGFQTAASEADGDHQIVLLQLALSV